jgi:hypothetical protein
MISAFSTTEVTETNGPIVRRWSSRYEAIEIV